MNRGSKIRTIIVDDEPLARAGLNHLLRQINRIEVVAEAANGFEALELVNELRPDLLLLDIQMPGINGFEVLQQITHLPLVIFTTAYDQYALEAFETLAIDYLLKPIRLERLQRSISKFDSIDRSLSNLGPLINPAKHREMRPAHYLRRFVSHQGTKWHIIEEGKVILFYAEGRYSFVRTEKMNYIVNYTLQNLEGKLDPKRFIRVHRSAIVALDKIRSIKSLGSGRLKLLMSDGLTQDVSRSHAQEVKQRCLGKTGRILTDHIRE
ncbi:MAG: LytR/AlgR family response regulator transcription factor, partial [bacterium]